MPEPPHTHLVDPPRYLLDRDVVARARRFEQEDMGLPGFLETEPQLPTPGERQVASAHPASAFLLKRFAFEIVERAPRHTLVIAEDAHPRYYRSRLWTLAGSRLDELLGVTQQPRHAGASAAVDAEVTPSHEWAYPMPPTPSIS